MSKDKGIPMTTADAKRALVAARMALSVPNVSEEVMRDALDRIDATLEASPNSRTEAITNEMIETDLKTLVRASIKLTLVDDAMADELVRVKVRYQNLARPSATQAARPIDQQEVIKAKREIDLTREEAIERFGQPNAMGHITRSSDSSIYDEKCVRCGMVDQAKRNIDNTPCPDTFYTPIAPVQDDER